MLAGAAFFFLKKKSAPVKKEVPEKNTRQKSEETDDSDIDLRIEHMNDFDLFDLSEMSYLLKLKTGKSVDIATQETSKMDPAFYNSIKQDEICLYERA